MNRASESRKILDRKVAAERRLGPAHEQGITSIDALSQ